MKIDIKPLNNGQKYPCSIQRIKELFRDTEIDFMFTHGNNSFGKGLRNPLYKFANKNVKGKVLMYFILGNQKTHQFCCVYAMQESELTSKLLSEIDNEVLPKISADYLQISNDRNIDQVKYIMIVELLDNTIKLHKQKTT